MIAEGIRLEFTRAVSEELSFLLGMGYSFAGVRENTTDAIGSSLEGSYTNPEVNRLVSVDFLPRRDTPRSVAVTRIKLLVPEPIDAFDYTSLGSMEVCVSGLAPAGVLTASLRQHLRESARVLVERFGGVLAGRDWQSDHLDWGDLK